MLRPPPFQRRLLLLLCLYVSPPSLLARELTDPGSDHLDLANTTDSASSNTTSSLYKLKEGSFADIIDKALDLEFNENEQPEVPDAGSFNNSVAGHEAGLETVFRVPSKKNDTNEENPFERVFNLDDNGAEETPTLIDSNNNVYTISYLNSKYPALHLGLRLISDLVVVIVFATCGGIAFACAGQPVETVAQFGVIFLLFALGLEFSTAKLKVVRAVAILGGLLQITLFIFLCGITALFCGASPSDGVFVGAFLSMSSTAVVLKFLMEKNSTNVLHGQVTIGILILQVGMSLAQIGEFAFVLLSRASNLHLVEGNVYLLLLGTTALSLMTTPILFKVIPTVTHLGVLLRWFHPDAFVEVAIKGDNFRLDSDKQ